MATKTKAVPAFLMKTFNMVSDANTNDIVSWNEKGDGFVVKKEFEFSSQLLPRYFRHRNFSSFVRQLNFYGFRKRSVQSKFSHFKHKYFRQGQMDLLHLIKRKTNEQATGLKEAVDQLKTQVTELKQQYEEVWSVQHQILYILSRYVRANPPPVQPRQGIPSFQRPTLFPSQRDGHPPSKRPRLQLTAPDMNSDSAIPSSSSSVHISPSSSPEHTLNTDAPPVMPDGSSIEVIDDDDDFDQEDFDAEDSHSTPSAFHSKDRQKTWQSLNALQQVIDSLPAGREILGNTPIPRQMPRANSLDRGMPMDLPSNGIPGRPSTSWSDYGLGGPPGVIQFPEGMNPLGADRTISPLPFDFDFNQPSNNQLATTHQNPHRMLSMIKNTLGRGGSHPNGNGQFLGNYEPLTLSPSPTAPSVEFLDDDGISLPPSASSATAFAPYSSTFTTPPHLPSMSVAGPSVSPVSPVGDNSVPSYSSPMTSGTSSSSLMSSDWSNPPTLQPLCTTGTSPATIYEVNGTTAPDIETYSTLGLPTLPDWTSEL